MAPPYIGPYREARERAFGDQGRTHKIMNVTETHLHHMAKRHHSVLKKLEGIKGKLTHMTGRGVSVLEVAAGAWMGGVIEGRTAGKTVLHVPLNLALGLATTAAGLLDLAGPYSEHLSNLGEGMVASYTAAAGFAFGQRWRTTGKLFARGAAAPAPAPAAAAAAGDLSPAQVNQIIAQMQQAAAAHG